MKALRLSLFFLITFAVVGYVIFEFNVFDPLSISEQKRLPAFNSTQKLSASAAVIQISKGENFAERLQDALISAPPGSIVEIPEGRFNLKDEISISKPFITLRGKGKGKTILDFDGQTAGKQGIFATNDGVTLEDFTVLNTDGNGVKVTGSNGVVIRRIEMKWTRGPDSNNGGYAIYPVSTQNLLIEECEVSGASDSGIYVGQSKNVIVRNNLAYGNVAGIEIENTQNADVYHNKATENSAGILIFDLPNLNLRQGGQIRIFDNTILRNNLRNYAPAGNIVSSVAKGIGLLVVATKNIEIFNNKFSENDFSDMVMVNYLITGIKIEDESVFDPTPHSIFIHDNQTNGKRSVQINLNNEINLVANWLFQLNIPDVMYDGIRDGTYNKTKFEGDKRICVVRNSSAEGKPATFGNMHLDSGRKQLIFPGGPVTWDIDDHNCELKPIAPVVLSQPRFERSRYPDVVLSENDQCRLITSQRVNFKAAEMADCTQLSSYNLFADSKNPLGNPLSNGFQYDLASTLFSDYALKSRFIFLPDGLAAKYRDPEVFDFPVGTIISKTFWYTNPISQKIKLIETRLLIRRSDSWVALPYIWNENQTEANLSRGGKTFDLSTDWIGSKSAQDKKTFSYHVPNANQCLNCHNLNSKMSPIGPKAKWLNRNGVGAWVGKNQIQQMLAEKHLMVESNDDLAALPKADNYNDATVPLPLRARAYLDINCSHCHNPGGSAGMSGLWLELERDLKSPHVGICKHPVAAGTAAAKLKYDIVPGNPDQSILIRRLRSQRPANKMPELGRNLVHQEGVQLIENWIRQLDGTCK
ncbi:MAG: right-handed parallel beta-helix repeat-containing protein [Moraxellaceae bacterium]|nr:right-handed parallel beta-helix repeat-containing protein [Pseudobdellovibrionaceae bacterium]